MPDFADSHRYQNLRVETASWWWDRSSDSPIVEIEFSNGSEIQFRVVNEALKMAIDADLHLGPISDEDDELNAETMQEHLANGNLVPLNDEQA